MTCLKQCRKKVSCAARIVKYISSSRFSGALEKERTLSAKDASNVSSNAYLPSVVTKATAVQLSGSKMTTWHKRDWKQFYELARRPWQRHRPPRPIYPTGINRVLPAAGFSLSELDDAGLDLDLAESLGLPVDAGRIGAYGPNVTTLRDFVRSSRHPL
jgi:ribosomal protein L13E